MKRGPHEEWELQELEHEALPGLRKSFGSVWMQHKVSEGEQWEKKYTGSLGQDHRRPPDFGIKSEGAKESFLEFLASKCYRQTHFLENPSIILCWTDDSGETGQQRGIADVSLRCN